MMRPHFPSALLTAVFLLAAGAEAAADLELRKGQRTPGSNLYQWDVVLPEPSVSADFVLDNFELRFTPPDGDTLSMEIVQVVGSRPILDGEGVPTGEFSSAGVRTTTGEEQVGTYVLLVQGALRDAYEAKGHAVSSPELEIAGDPSTERGWSLGDGRPRFTINPRTTQAPEDLAIDFAVDWAKIDLERFGELTDLSYSELFVTADTKGYYKPDLKEARGAGASLNALETDLALRWDHFTNPKSRSRQTTILGFDLHGSHEGTQDFDSNTYNVGAGLVLQPGFLLPIDAWEYNVLASNDRPDLAPPRLYLGYDLVTDADGTSRQARTGESDDTFSRGEVGVYWGLPAFQGDTYLEASYRGFWDFEAQRDSYNDLWDLKLYVDAEGFFGSLFSDNPDEPTGQRSPFLIQYISGALPPDFGTENSLSAGFHFSF